MWTIEGDQAEAHLGISVGSAGDVNADGFSDVIVGADFFANGQVEEGRAFVFHGSGTALVTVAFTSPPEGTPITPANQSAFALSGTCSEAGQPVVISGAASASPLCTGDTWTATFDLTSAADGPLGFTVNHQDALGNAAAPASRNFVKSAQYSVRLSGPVSPTTQGAAHDLRIEIVDGTGTVATTYQGALTLSSSDPSAQLPGSVSFELTDSGVQQLSKGLVFWTPGTHSVQAVDQANSAISGSLTGIVVDAASALAIIEDANPRAAVGVPYRYNALGRVRAIGEPPYTFGSCGGPSGFGVAPGDGYVQWTPSSAGPHTLCVSAQNGTEQVQYSFVVDVAASAPPAPEARLKVTPASGAAPLAVSLDGSTSVGHETALPLMYVWDFGDGSEPGTGVTVGHVFASPGTHTPTLTVYDAFGSSASMSGEVVVLPGPSSVIPPGVRMLKVGCGCAAGDGEGARAWLPLGLAVLFLLRRGQRPVAQ